MEYKILEDNETIYGIFCFVDIKGHTQWAHKNGDEKLKDLLEILYGNGFEFFGKDKYTTVNKVKYKRRVVKFLGDGFFAVMEYNNNDNADICKKINNMLRQINCFYKKTTCDIKNNITNDLGLKFGITVGKSKRFKVNKRLDYIGDTVNVASRLCGCSNGGEIWIQIKDDDDDDIISKEFKRYAGPICNEPIKGIGCIPVKKIELPLEVSEK